jgi:hypothetical protein
MKILLGICCLLSIALGQEQKGSVYWFDNQGAVIDSASTYQFVLNDGSQFIARVKEAYQYEIAIETISGLKITLRRTNIESWNLPRGEVVGLKFFPRDPNYTRLFFAPTGRTLKAGQGYFADYYVFFGALAVGLNDWITLSGGTFLLPGARELPFFFMPKVRVVHQEKLDVSAGALIIFIPGLSESVGIAYGVGTLGSSKGGFTFGLGYGFVGSDFANEPLMMLGGEIQVSRGTKFLGETWFSPSANGSFGILGIRFFGERLATDLGFMVASGSDPIPWVDFVYNFGK